MHTPTPYSLGVEKVTTMPLSSAESPSHQLLLRPLMERAPLLQGVLMRLPLRSRGCEYCSPSPFTRP